MEEDTDSAIERDDELGSEASGDDCSCKSLPAGAPSGCN